MQDWLRDGRSKIEDLVDVEDEYWDKMVSQILDDIESDLRTVPERAFSKMMNLLNFMESAARALPHVARIISGYIGRIKKTLGEISKYLGASSYTISVGTPFYLNFSMNFSTQS